MSDNNEIPINVKKKPAMTEEEIRAAEDFYTKLRNSVTETLQESQVEKNIADALFFLPDLFMLVIRLIKDNRVGLFAKLQLAVAITYVISPFDLIPDFFPPLGWVDDVFVVALILSRVLRITGDSGKAVVYDLWEGDQDAIKVIRGLAVELNRFFDRIGLLNLLYVFMRRFR